MKYYQKLHKNSSNQQILKKVEDDDSYKITCTEEDQDYLDWVAAGNTVEEAG